MGLLAQAAKALSAFSGNKGRSAVRPTPQYVPAKAKPAPKKRPPPLLPKHRDPPLEEVEATLREKPRDKRSLILAARFRFREGNYRGSIDAACKSIEEGGPSMELELLQIRAHAAWWASTRKGPSGAGDRKNMQYFLERAVHFAGKTLAWPRFARRVSLILETAGAHFRANNHQKAADLVAFAVTQQVEGEVGKLAQYALAHIALAGGRADAAIQLHEDLELTYWLKEDASWRHVRDGYGMAEKESCCLLPLPPLDIHREVEDLAFRLAADHADILVSQARFYVEIKFRAPHASCDRVGSMAWRLTEARLYAALQEPSRHKQGERDRFLADRMELNEWVAHPAPLKLFGDKYREDGDEKGLCRASPAVALALYKASLAKMPEEDRWRGSDEVDEVRLAIAECLEELGDYERALEEARVTLRGQPLEEVDTRLSALLARLSQEALPPDAPEAVEYRRVASIKSVAARKIQLRHKRFAVAKDKWAATMVQARWRGLRAFRKQKEWQEFLRGSRFAEGLTGEVGEEFLREQRQFIAELETMTLNQRERAIAKRKRELEAMKPYLETEEDRRRAAERNRHRAAQRCGKAWLGRDAGHSTRMELRTQGWNCGRAQDWARADRDLASVPFASPARHRGTGGWAKASAPARVAVIQARAGGAPIASCASSTLADLGRADALIIRRALATSRDIIRISKAISPPDHPETPREGPVLHALELDCPRVCGVGLEALCRAVERLPALTSLRVDRADNTISYRGLDALARVLRASPTLARLAVTGNNVGTALVGPVLANALPDATKLVSLRLAACRLDDAQASQLAYGVKDASSLRELHLEHNSFGATGIKHLLLTAVLGRKSGQTLWTLTLRDQQPSLRRCDVRDAAQAVSLKRDDPEDVKLFDNGSVPVDERYWASHGFAAPKLEHEVPGARILPPLHVEPGSKVQVRWLQQRLRDAETRWRDATVTQVASTTVKVRYEGPGGNFSEDVSPYLLRWPPADEEDGPTEDWSQPASSPSRAGTARARTTEAPAEAELRLPRSQAYVTRDGLVGTISTRDLLKTVPRSDLAIMGLVPRPPTPVPPHDDELAALPVTAVNLVVEHEPSELPVGKGLDAFATDHDFAKFAEDRRRSLRTTVFF